MTLICLCLHWVELCKIDMTDTTQEEVTKELSKCTGITNLELIGE
jgi:hypothetical protein